ncbi:hypothetical protein Hte_007649 [Hypoxylon texense]
MDYSIHLVIVSGAAAPQAGNDGGPKAFLAQRFPDSRIDEFSFFDSSSSIKPLLRRRADALLKQLQKSRGSSKSPIIFLAHGLGGYVVKQALVSATEEPRYRDILSYTSATLFFGVPHRATRDKTWQYIYLHLLSVSGSLQGQVVQPSIEELESVSVNFQAISCSFVVANFFEESVLDKKYFTLNAKDEIIIRSGCRHKELWDFTRANRLAKEVYQQIIKAKNGARLLLREFICLLSSLDPQTHQLRPEHSTLPSLDWIHINDAFISWKTDPIVGTLRISGPSGSGMTTTAAHILGILLDQAGWWNTTCLSFSFDKNNIEANTPFSLYLSLCRQLLSSWPRLFQHISLVSKFLTSNGFLNAETLWVMVRRLMERLLDDPKVSIFCVINSIDECAISQAKVVRRMEEIATLANGRFKLLLSGINLLESSSQAGRHRDINLGSREDKGLVASRKQYVHHRISEIAVENPTWRGLEDVAVSRLDALPADSPFLLVKLNMFLLEQTTRHSTRKDLMKKLHHQPTTLRDCYNQVMDTIDIRNRGWIIGALRWITYAVRPLRPTELVLAVALDGMSRGHSWKYEELDTFDDLIRGDITRGLQDFMGPLIKIEDNCVYLIHDTFRDFLLDTFFQTTWQRENYTSAPESKPTQNEGILVDQHSIFFFHCLEYLKSFCHRGYEHTDLEFSLLGYASVHWPEHFRRTASKSLARNYVWQFLQDEKSVESWLNLYRQSKLPLKSINEWTNNPLEIVCSFGLMELVDDCILLAKRGDDYQDQMRELLDHAAQNGHNDVVQALLRQDIRSPESLGLAAAGGFEDVVESLLAVESDINKPDQTGYTAIHLATCGGHEHIVSLLLERGADPDVSTPNPDSRMDIGELKPPPSKGNAIPLSLPCWRETSLHLAALTGQVEIAKILLSKGADVHAESSSTYDSLKYAAAGGSPEMLVLLLQHDADGHRRAASDGNSALNVAAAHGHYKAAEVLLRDVSDGLMLIHATNHSGLSPIHVAAREGYLDLLGLMLDAEDSREEAGNNAGKASKNQPVSLLSGSHPSRRSSVQWIAWYFHIRKDHRKSALEWAAECGHSRVVRALLDRKNVTKPDRACALNLAAQNGHTDVVSTLLDNRLTEVAIDFENNTALHLAAKGGHSKTLSVLLGRPRGATLFKLIINHRTAERMTPLHLAAQAGHADTIRILLKHEALESIDAGEDKTALHFAAENGHLACVEILLQRGHKSEPAAVAKHERTAMHLAAHKGHLSVVKRLCAFENIIWMEDKFHYTAFDLVVQRKRVEEVKEFIRILEETADDGNEFVRGGMPLHLAAQFKNTEVLRLLLDRGWKCDVRDGKGNTPLHRAAMKKFVQGIEVLVQNPTCEPNSRNNRGYTAIHLARTPELVSALLQAGAENDPKRDDGSTPLCRAAYWGLLDKFQAHLNSTPKPDLGVVTVDGLTLLHRACGGKRMSLSIVKLILEHGINDINALCNGGWTPLALAIRRHHREAVKLLLSAGADPNLRGSLRNWPLLSEAISRNLYSFDLVQLLTDRGADLLARDSEGNTVLDVALKYDKILEIEYISQKLEDIEMAEVGDVYVSALYKYISRTPRFDPEFADLLVRRGPDASTTMEQMYSTALHGACRNGRMDSVKWLLEKGADVNMMGGEYGSALCAAIEGLGDSPYSAAIEGRGDSPYSLKLVTEKVRLLLEKGCDIDFVGDNHPTALQRAASKSSRVRTEILDLLLSKGANANLTGGDLDTPLNAAILNDVAPNTIRIMLANGADVAKVGLGGRLPVHMAAAGKGVDVLHILDSARANLLARDADGRSALMYGILNSNQEAVEFLLRNYAFDRTEKNAMHQTPLILAAMFGLTEIIPMLLSRGFGAPNILNAQDHEGKTALMHLVSVSSVDLKSVIYLVRWGADPRIVDCRNRSALYWAARLGQATTLKQIIDALSWSDYYEKDKTAKYWEVAVHGAILSRSNQKLEILLKKEYINLKYAGADQWSPLYTARLIGLPSIKKRLLEKRYYSGPLTTPLKRPSSWHSSDKSPGLKLESNGTTLSTVGGTHYLKLKRFDSMYGTARSDYPMVPLFKDKVYYFEVKIVKSAEKGYAAIGFCADKASLHTMLGWERGSWGFHSEEGDLHANGADWARKYDAPYGVGDVVGCGVDFAKQSAFYTRNGKVIGQAFLISLEKLYPAISMDITQEGWEISAVFPGKDGESKDFMYQGDYESETQIPPTVEEESEESEESEASEESEESDSEDESDSS